jgi:hypothetical protein
MPGTITNTDEAGVVAESVRNNTPSTPSERGRPGRPCGTGGSLCGSIVKPSRSDAHARTSKSCPPPAS